MEPMDIYQIVYASKATCPMPPEELAKILEIARRRNQAAEITGMLLFRHGHFLQVLEGPEERVLALLDKLGRDARHEKVRVLLDGQVKARAFGTWSMAFQDISGIGPGDLPGYSRFLTRGFGSTEVVRYPHKALRMIMAFRDTDLARFESQTQDARPLSVLIKAS